MVAPLRRRRRHRLPAVLTLSSCGAGHPPRHRIGLQDIVHLACDLSEGVLVSILHDLNFRIPALSFIADPVIGGFFIDNIANKTLRAMKRHLESAR